MTFWNARQRKSILARRKTAPQGEDCASSQHRRRELGEHKKLKYRSCTCCRLTKAEVQVSSDPGNRFRLWAAGRCLRCPLAGRKHQNSEPVEASLLTCFFRAAGRQHLGCRSRERHSRFHHAPAKIGGRNVLAPHAGEGHWNDWEISRRASLGDSGSVVGVPPPAATTEGTPPW